MLQNGGSYCDHLCLLFEMILSVLSSFLISRKRKHVCSPLCSVWKVNELLQVSNHPVYVISQASRSVSSLGRREVTKDEHCCLTARWDTSCVYSHCAALRDVVQCSWMQLLWDGSSWTVADTLRHSCLSEATLLQLDTSSFRVAGRQRTDKRLDSFPPCS